MLLLESRCLSPNARGPEFPGWQWWAQGPANWLRALTRFYVAKTAKSKEPKEPKTKTPQPAMFCLANLSRDLRSGHCLGLGPGPDSGSFGQAPHRSWPKAKVKFNGGSARLSTFTCRRLITSLATHFCGIGIH